MASAVRTRIIPALLLVAIAGIVWWARRKPPQTYSSAYVSDRSVTVWSTTAQVREQLAELDYGQRVSVLGQSGNSTEVRTGSGVQGWVDSELLMTPDLWQRGAILLADARMMPVQAVGHTRAASNVHMDPSRAAPRIFQFGRNTPVVVLERRTSAAPGPAETPAAQPVATGSATETGENSAPESAAPEEKQEDWLLVLHEPSQASAASAGGPNANGSPSPDAGQTSASEPSNVPIAGWVLARFIELDPPAPISDYASSAGLRIVAWLVLNEAGQPGAQHPQYLLAGTHGGEGQPCDFTSLRVYTWGEVRSRYETAYVENDLCGQLPIRASGTPDGAEFRFRELDENGDRLYRMKQTIVRLVRSNSPDERRTR